MLGHHTIGRYAPHARLRGLKMNMMTTENAISIDTDLTQLLHDGAIAKELNLGPAELQLALGVANLKLNTGQPERALQMYTVLVLCDPLNIEFQCGLANCAIQMQEHELALQAASSMIANAPRDCRGYYFSAVACLGMRQLEEAREDIVDAMDLARQNNDPDIFEAASRLNEQLNTKFS